MTTPERTTRDLLHSLTIADVIETFYRLPSSEQERFTTWISKAADDEAYWRRIDILVLAMRMSPPVEPKEDSPAEPGVSRG